MPFGVGENNGKVKEQISRFDHWLKENGEKNRDREIDDKTIICMLKNLPPFFFFFFTLKISLLGISWQFVANGWRSDLLEA